MALKSKSMAIYNKKCNIPYTFYALMYLSFNNETVVNSLMRIMFPALDIILNRNIVEEHFANNDRIHMGMWSSILYWNNYIRLLVIYGFCDGSKCFIFSWMISIWDDILNHGNNGLDECLLYALSRWHLHKK